MLPIIILNTGYLKAIVKLCEIYIKVFINKMQFIMVDM